MRYRAGFLALLGIAAVGCSFDSKVKDIFSETMRTVDNRDGPALSGSGTSESISNSGNAATLADALHEGSYSLRSGWGPCSIS